MEQGSAAGPSFSCCPSLLSGPSTKPRPRIDRAFVAAEVEADLAVGARAAQRLAVGDAVAGFHGGLVEAGDHRAPAGAEVEDHHLAPAAERTGPGDATGGGGADIETVAAPAPAA